MKNLELSLYCKTCNRSNLERSIPKSKAKASSRDICPECGAYGAQTMKTAQPKNEATHAIQATTNYTKVTLPTSGSRVKKEMVKWKFKQYEQKDAALLAQIMVAWAEENKTETTYTKFLVDIAHCSYGKLQRMGAECQELQDALDIVGEIFAERIREEWKADERMDINKYAPKMFDLMSPLVKAKEQAKLKVELSAERGVPYHDPTYPNLSTPVVDHLLTKGEQ